MPTSVPSPTPITGVRTVGGKPSPRLPISDFQADHPLAFSLYVQALAKWQEEGSEALDKDNVTGTSYFQVVGVHGVPAVPWQSDPTPVADATVGYCTHRSVLFVPWHRPYLMLYEQIIHAYAEDIANSAQGYAKEAYTKALPEVRLPYWDWASDPSIPQALMTPEIKLTVPGAQEGATDTLELKHNPLFSYQFKSDYAKEKVRECMGWIDSENWAESKRCPDFDGHSHPEVANMQVGTFTYFKDQTFQHLLKAKDFDEFTTQAWRDGQNFQAYTSIETMHNNVHNYVGTNDSVIKDKNTKMLGSMTEVQASSFDPIFWLHHVNCDRLAALWQALNTNVEIKTFPSMLPRYTAKTNNEENGESRLEPWHKTADQSDKSYYIANDMKELTSTFANGYYYPETPLNLLTDPAGMKKYTTSKIYELYAPQYLQPPLQAPAPGPDTPAGDKPGEMVPPAEGTPVSGVSSETWQVFLRVRNFALVGTWAVHIFLEEVPNASEDWFTSGNRIGSITMLSTLSRDSCSNCRSQAENDQLVTGTVPLTDALIARGIDVNSENEVVEYLKKYLSWRVARDTKEEPITDDLGLVVGVSSQKLTLPSSLDQPLQYEPSRLHPEITTGKPGGLNEAAGNALGLST